MKSRLTLFTLLLFCVTYSSELLAQNDSIPDASFYLNDTGFSIRKNVIKVNLLSVIYGDLPVYYERAITNSFSIEVGAGVLLPYYFPKLSQYDEDIEGVENPIGGTSIWIQPKLYYGGRAPENSYVGVQWRQRNYNLENNEVRHTDISLNFGYQLVLGKRLIFDYNAGVGFGMKKSKIDEGTDGLIGLTMPIGIKLGIIL